MIRDNWRLQNHISYLLSSWNLEMCNFHVGVAIVPNQSFLWFEHHHQPLTLWQPLSEPWLGVSCFSSRLFPPHGDSRFQDDFCRFTSGAPYIHLSPGWHGKDGIENEVVSIASIRATQLLDWTQTYLLRTWDNEAELTALFSRGRTTRPGLWWIVVASRWKVWWVD